MISLPTYSRYLTTTLQTLLGSMTGRERSGNILSHRHYLYSQYEVNLTILIENISELCKCLLPACHTCNVGHITLLEWATSWNNLLWYQNNSLLAKIVTYQYFHVLYTLFLYLYLNYVYVITFVGDVTCISKLNDLLCVLVLILQWW